MMEVKQNTAVDLNELMTLAKDGGTDEIDDAVMTDITDRTQDLVNCDLIKSNDEKTNITETENGDIAMTSLIKDVDCGVDLNTTVNSELEDALLAEDDVLPNIQSPKIIEPSLSASDDILAEKAETSNSTTSSSNVRDPGDDLDTLLSKINDIVEDCIENETENAISNTMKPDLTINKIVENEEENALDNESLLLSEEASVVVDDAKLVEDKQPGEITNDNNKKMEQSGTNDDNLTDKDVLISSALSEHTDGLLNNIDELTKNESDKPCNDETSLTEFETEVDINKDTNQSISIENKIANNLNIEKTEELNAETVQDNKITSNSNEVYEAVKTLESGTIENGDIISSEKAFDSDELKKPLENDQDSEETIKNKLSETEKSEKNQSEEAITSGNVENDDSDDEIVFYVDKPPEKEKSKETDTKVVDTGMEITTTTQNSVHEEEISPVKKTDQVDEVVLLLDDDDEEVDHIKKESNKEVSTKSPDEQTISPEGMVSADSSANLEKKDIVIDNSDNARDDFETENSIENEKTVDKPEVTETAEETNSNCSSSSNLLQEAKSVKNSVDEPTLEEAEIEEEEDEGEVELIESELKDSETLQKAEDSEISPPAKRIRLSEDGEKTPEKHESGESDEVESLNMAEKTQEPVANSENSFLPTHSKLKRSHDVIELETDEKSNDSKASNEGNDNKKPKTSSLNDDVVISEIIDEIKDFKEHENKKDIMDDSKTNMKAVPSYEPIRLYPAPKFGTLKSGLPMSLDFLKKFRKSFDNMTKHDLEDLVLQKVVEAIIHRSEFSEMRELIEKQEKIINAHRSKISELSKQFRDLEMVHNRVVKDIEQRNSQFIMPVKITRAVGLQVYIPNKKTLVETASSSTAPNILSSPQRPVSSQASSTPSTSLTPPQRQLLSSQSETQQQRPTGITSSGPGNSGNVRRGCVQKITPIRPVPGGNQPTSTGSTAISSAYRNTTNHSAPTQPRILNKNATTAVNATAIQRSRYLGSNQDGQRIAPQQISRTSNTPVNSQRSAANSATQSKPTSNIVTSVQRRSDPVPPQTANSSTSLIVDNYINTLTHLTGGNTAVSITPAKPKEKAVIDLTDEDETPGQSVGAQIPGTQVPRRILPAQNSSSSSLQYGRAQASMGRVPPSNQMTSNKNRQISSLQGAQKNNTFTSINTPPGTSITRVNVAPNAQRVKYSHPAPLPATPPQAFNPSWKLPPPRPTIRISNLDNGIVISWTMEESMDRHAECVSYQIYAYQETSGPPMVDSWRHVGDVKAMLLPMAVTLTQFQEGQRYYFAVRAVDCHQRYGPFSLPKTWS